MMISPELFIEQYKNKTYAELLEVRDELICSIKLFESAPEDEDEGFIMHPSPDVVYQMHHKYLSGICLLIVQKYREQQGLEDW